MLALATLFAGVEAHAQCTKDFDCGGEQVCDEGKCTEPAVTPAAPVATPATLAEPVATPATPATTAEAPAPGRHRAISRPHVITVESPPVVAPPHFEPRSAPLAVAGGFAVAAGLIGLGVGVLSNGSNCYRELGDDFQVEHCSPDYVAYVVGGLLLAAGIPMIVIGRDKVRVESEARLSPWFSPRGGGLVLNLQL